MMRRGRGDRGASQIIEFTTGRHAAPSPRALADGLLGSLLNLKVAKHGLARLINLAL
jgi:hypothetical protein